MNLSDYKPGDYYFFSKSFSSNEFQIFSSLSNDTNKLHYDINFALETNFQKPILPLHLSLSPLSHVCGNVFPGLPSLIHSIESKAYLPVYYDSNINYTSVITSVSLATSTLRISSLLYDDCFQVQASAVHTVGLTSTEWEQAEDTPIHHHLQGIPLYLIFGSSSQIASNFLESLCTLDVNILAVSRSPLDVSDLAKLNDLKARNTSLGRFYSLSHDGDSFDSISDFISSNYFCLTHVFFFPSLPIKSSISDHISVSYEFLLDAINCCLPFFMKQQNGRFYFISSTSVGKLIPDFTNYSLAKALGETLVQSYQNYYSRFRIFFSSIRLPLVSTNFSASVSNQSWKSMNALEVADYLLKISQMTSVQQLYILDPSDSNSRLLVSTPSITEYSDSTDYLRISDKGSSSQNELSSQPNEVHTIFNDYLASLLSVPHMALLDARLGHTPTWDSLAHVQIISKIEQLTNSKVSPSELESVRCYDDLLKLLRERLNA